MLVRLKTVRVDGVDGGRTLSAMFGEGGTSPWATVMKMIESPNAARGDILQRQSNTKIEPFEIDSTIVVEYFTRRNNWADVYNSRV